MDEDQVLDVAEVDPSADPPSSLVPIRESLGEEAAKEQVRCPRVPWDVVAVEDPTLRFPATCKTWGCEYCGPRKARQKAAVVAWAKPERFVTLTLAPKEWQARRARVAEFARTLRRDGFDWQMAWTCERGEVSPDLVHIHGLQHGSYVPQRLLQQRWGARVDVRAIRGARKAAGYALKEAQAVTGYATKGTDDLAAHLELNGGRGVHLTRGYLRGRTTDEVLSLLAKERGEFTWVLVRQGVTLDEVGLCRRLHAAEIPPEMALSSTTAH